MLPLSPEDTRTHFTTVTPRPDTAPTPTSSQPESPQRISSTSWRQSTSYEQSRVSALRGELQDVQAGVVRILSGLQELGEDVPDSRETVFRSDLLETRLESASASLRDTPLPMSTPPDLPPTHASRRGHASVQTMPRSNMDVFLGHDGATHNHFTPTSAYEPGAEVRPPTAPNSRVGGYSGPALGTREEVESPDYQSPITSMFQRAYDRYHQAETRRREATQRMTSDCPPLYFGQQNPQQMATPDSSGIGQPPAYWALTPDSHSQARLHQDMLRAAHPSGFPHQPVPNPLQTANLSSNLIASTEATQGMANPLLSDPPLLHFGAFAASPNLPTTHASYGFSADYPTPFSSTTNQPRARHAALNRRRNAATDIHPARMPFVSPAGHDEVPSATGTMALSHTTHAPLDHPRYAHVPQSRAGYTRSEYGHYAGYARLDGTRTARLHQMIADGVPLPQILALGGNAGEADEDEGSRVTFDTQKRPPPLDEEEMMQDLACAICHEHKIDTVVLPCGHAAMCNYCAEIHVPFRKHGGYIVRGCEAKCPICRKQIKEMVGQPIILEVKLLTSSETHLLSISRSFVYSPSRGGVVGKDFTQLQAMHNTVLLEVSASSRAFFLRPISPLMS